MIDYSLTRQLSSNSIFLSINEIYRIFKRRRKQRMKTGSYCLDFLQVRLSIIDHLYLRSKDNSSDSLHQKGSDKTIEEANFLLPSMWRTHNNQRSVGRTRVTPSWSLQIQVPRVWLQKWVLQVILSLLITIKILWIQEPSLKEALDLCLEPKQSL